MNVTLTQKHDLKLTQFICLNIIHLDKRTFMNFIIVILQNSNGFKLLRYKVDIQ